MKVTSLFCRLAVNTSGRDFVVGDIHGQMAMLDRLLEIVDFDTRRDRLIALGDLVDRGPDCAALLERVAAEPWFYSLRGNHEAMMLEAASTPWSSLFWSFDDNQWCRALDQQQFESLCEIIKGLPIALELPLPDGRTVGLVHAEVRLGHTWDDLRAVVVNDGDAFDIEPSTLGASALWGRTRIRAWLRTTQGSEGGVISADRGFAIWQAVQAIDGVDQVISGHSILEKRRPVAIGNQLYIDTGAYEMMGRMTLVEPLAGHYWQVRQHPHGRVRAIRLKPTVLPEPVPIPKAFWPSPDQLDKARNISEARQRLTRIAGYREGEIRWP